MTDPRSAVGVADLRQVIDRLHRDRPTFHGYGQMQWDVSPGTLDLLADTLKPSMRTLEVGLGASTVVFAAAGVEHSAVGPAPHEFELIRTFCARIGVDTTAVTYLHGRSDRVLPLIASSFDVALVDGAHAFPTPLIDFHYVSQHLEEGGLLILDDLPIPSVQMLYRTLLTEPHWIQETIVDDRAAAFRLVAPLPSGDPWKDQPLNRSYPNYSFLPVGRRVRRNIRSMASSSPRLRAMAEDHPGLARPLRRLLGDSNSRSP